MESTVHDSKGGREEKEEAQKNLGYLHVWWEGVKELNVQEKILRPWTQLCEGTITERIGEEDQVSKNTNYNGSWLQKGNPSAPPHIRNEV